MVLKDQNFSIICCALSVVFLVLITPDFALSQTPGSNQEEWELVFFNPDTTSNNPLDATNALQTFANVVNKKEGWNIRAYYFKKQVDLEHFLDTRKVEFGILSQMFIVENHEKYGIEPFAVPLRDGKPTYRKVIVVKKDSSFRDLQDLKGTVLAATALGEENNPFYNSVVFRGEIDIETHFKEIKTVDSVNSAVLAVLFGQADAAAVTARTFEIAQELNPKVKNNLMSIFTSEETPISPMCQLKDADKALVPKFRDILFNIHNDPVGRQSCLAFNVEAWIPTSMDDYKETARLLKEGKVLAKAVISEKSSPVSQPGEGTQPVSQSTPVEQLNPVIEKVQLFKEGETTVICNAWINQGKAALAQDKIVLVYVLNNEQQKSIPLKSTDGKKYTASFSLPPAKSSDSQIITYVVKPGDTLGKIAEKFLGSSKQYAVIASFNDLQNPNIITVDQQLKIKTGETVVYEVIYSIKAEDESGNIVHSQEKKKSLI